MADDTPTDPATETTDGNIDASYTETEGERLLSFNREGKTAVVAQNIEGYAMLRVRRTADGDEIERYYGLEMALDHAAELLSVDSNRLPVPEAAADMGM